MRKETILTHNWYFTKAQQKEIPTYADKAWKKVTLPHTWNAKDGQDGGADYHRGACWYLKELNVYDIRIGREYAIEFGAAGYDAIVYLNGMEVTRHKGGYSKFRANLTPFLKKGKNTLVVKVSNEACDTIYPQMADFTFYGGLHRPAKFIELPETHFDEGCWCASGVRVWSDVKENGDALLHLKCKIKNPYHADTVRYTVQNQNGAHIAELYTDAKHGEITLPLQKVHLWQGILDPYLYTVTAELIRHNEILDHVQIKHGFRTFRVDPEKGFFLNGKLTPLRGVSRHQDKLGIGNALAEEDHMTDATLIREIGANTVRLAHYQQSEEFYALCDAYGFIVWAEIPFISKMLPTAEAHENALTQMNELIEQNFNHSSICFWGISNEITIGGDAEKLTENLKTLDKLVHDLDPTRLSTMAQVSMLPMESEQNHITDIVAYNHYFGWYGGTLTDNEIWLDQFHAKYPKRALGLSEYGCEGILTYHGDAPKMGDYSEEYQALYHEHMVKILHERPWLWGSYVWNMFDFGCDTRNEGGVMGRNNKGLVTFDRKIKKDAFYLYKAYWTAEPMVHICGKRYAKRKGDTITVKAYSNMPTLILSVNGMEIDKKSANHIFVFENIPIVKGTHTITVSAGELSDMAIFEITDELPEHYTLKEDPSEAGVTNWFDDKTAPTDITLTFKEGFYSVRDSVRDILKSEEAGTVLANAFGSVSGIKVKKSMLMMLADQTPEDILKNPDTAKRFGMNPDEVLALVNGELQKIKIQK